MKRSFVFLSMILLFTYCKSNIVEPTSSQEKVTDYFPLSIGNYWVYKVYSADSTLNFVDNNKIDSMYVQKDTVVSGTVYKVVRSTFFSETVLIRDSSNYLVTRTGKKLLTLTNSGEILSQESYPLNEHTIILSFKMKNIDSTCIVPSGNYLCKYVIGLQKSTESNSNYKDRKLFYAYSKGVGRVSRRLTYLISNNYFEERLIRYKIIDKK